jgi:uncharacterized membrane protein
MIRAPLRRVIDRKRIVRLIYALVYLAVLVAFLAVDAVWLYTMSSLLYRPTLGDILLEMPRLAPAIAFYLAFPIGIVVFAVLPGVRAGAISQAVLLGALFGALAYATYDLTNYATLKAWTLQITLVDIAWGALLSGFSAGAGYVAAVALRDWMGK